MNGEIPEDEILYMTGQTQYQCTGCIWKGARPSMSESSTIDPDTLAKRRHYNNICPDCGAPVRVAPSTTTKEQGR